LKPSGIEFDLPGEARVTLALFDPEGRELATLIDGQLFGPGTHAVDFIARGYTNGVYLYRLSIENGGERFVDTRRIVLGTQSEETKQSR
jgi:hypothetical protein